MAKQLVARGQATVYTQMDACTVTQSVSEYVFPATSAGVIVDAVSFTSTVKVTLGGSNIMDFTIGTITKPAGFLSITVNNTNKTITYAVASNTSGLADSGIITVPVSLKGETCHISFTWSKAKGGTPGKNGADANLLDWVSDWNTNKTQIGQESVITPKIYAGVKNPDGTLTGVALGRFPLSALNASGQVVTETVDGIYGFKDGNKTFFVDNNGNAQLGRGNQFIKYNAADGKVEFGAEVSLNWTVPIDGITTALGGSAFPKLTKIDANGIYTGTLTATQVNAVSIDASSIKTGTISAARIDVDSLKASLVTAANVEALTLNVIRGTIGGWTMDADSIFTGTKNNTSGAYTGTPGAMTIGPDGIRGYRWRLEATGAGAVAGGNIAWDASGNVTFAASVSLNWTAPVDDITTALGGSTFPKLTKIDAAGIYTGTLTAKQVNAVGIDAASINTGILSADRITAGSITAAKLDAASIKSSIINTDYISGLSCTFSKGTIGGWTIGSDHITGGSVGAVGDMPIQIRSAATGSGYWYNGAYKSRGITMTWHQSSNAGHFVFGQIAASGNSVKTGFIGIQMMAWDNTEYFCLSANSSLSGSKEVYNRIAGWAFDNNKIWKNSVALSADGSIQNGSLWQLNNDGSGRMANGNITWDASGNVTFAASVSLNWTVPVDSISAALGGSSFPKLTKIDAAGIYTGTLTASQVNAVSIDAASIKTGTLSADRIAVGSITAAKIDAASIKSSIINTDYISGLSCTFSKGTIGGWTIGSDHITRGSVGATGDMPIQIRSAATGSGYWYSGAYKPCGITMTWHQSSNAGHFVFGQIAASGNSVKTGFIGIQMMAWDNTEYFCLSANSTLSGSKEVYNRIAGWAFDNNKIWKNSVTLSADGSIQNGSLWQLNNNGSGRLANGNITWDASGNVTFASSVSLNWTSGIDTAKELAGAMAFGRMLYRDPTFYNGNNSINVYNNMGNGTVTITWTGDSNAPNDSKFALVIKNTGDSAPYCGGFYFGTATAYKKILVTRIIAKIPTGRNLSFHSNSMGSGGVQKWLTPVAGTGNWCEYICKVTCGTSGFSSTNYFSITGDAGTESAPVEWRIAYATVFDLTSSERYTTTIDANGIYTGTLSAGQVKVDTALVVGGSDYNGSVSVRDASNNIKVTLDRTGITATGGVIGGWTIASDRISKNSVVLSPDGSITNGTKWKLNNDGSGQFAGGNISWTASGTVTVTGTVNATAGQIGGFEIASGRIGSTASGSGNGGGLAIYNDLFRVGSSTSYVLFGDDTFPSSMGGSFTATGRITNNKPNSYFTNCGIYIDVTGASRNFGVYSNAALLAPALISNKIKTIVFSGSGYTIDFAQNNLFFIYGTANYSVTLPAESTVVSMFGLSSLPSDFACVFTLVYNYSYKNRITITGIRNHDGNLVNFGMEKGDTLTLICAKFPSFHYQMLNYRQS